VEHWLTEKRGVTYPGFPDVDASHIKSIEDLAVTATHKLRDAAASLPYTDDRDQLAGVLTGACQELRRAIEMDGPSLLVDAMNVVGSAVSDVHTLRDPTMSYY
jgi:predicted transcriptional regulator